VKFPLELDLSPYTFVDNQRKADEGEGEKEGGGEGEEDSRTAEGEEANQKKKKKERGGQSTKYRLTGIVEHSGSISGGHYVSYVNSTPTASTPSWHYWSDTHGSKANEGEVLGSEAYMLFYRREK